MRGRLLTDTWSRDECAPAVTRTSHQILQHLACPDCASGQRTWRSLGTPSASASDQCSHQEYKQRNTPSAQGWYDIGRGAPSLELRGRFCVGRIAVFHHRACLIGSRGTQTKHRLQQIEKGRLRLTSDRYSSQSNSPCSPRFTLPRWRHVRINASNTAVVRLVGGQSPYFYGRAGAPPAKHILGLGNSPTV